MKKRFGLVILLGFMIGLFLGLTYSKWEYLTWRYSSDLKAAIQNYNYKSDLPTEPKLLKVIQYKEQSAKVFMILWDSGGGDRIYVLRREMNGEWVVHDTELCTTSNGRASCFFPWYSPVRSIREQIN